MKNMYYVALATLVAAFSCAKEANLEKEQAPVQGHAVTLGVDIPATKIDYSNPGSAIHPVWAAGDQIEVVFGGTSEIFTLASGAGTQSATFTNGSSALTEGTEYAVYYPAKDYDWSVQDGTLAHLPNYLVKTGLNSLTASINLEPQLTYFVLNFTEKPEESITDGALYTGKVYLESNNAAVKLHNKTEGSYQEGIITINHDASFAADGTPADANLYIAAHIEGNTEGVSNAFSATFMNGDLANKASVRNYSWTWTPSSDYAPGNGYFSPSKTNGYNAGTVIGLTDNSTGWWTAFSDYYTIPVGKKVTLDFVNHSGKEENFHNWLLIVTNDNERDAGSYAEYFALRSDNFGWGNSNFRRSELTSNFNWSVFKDEMDGAQISITIEHVKDGYAIVNADIKTANYNWFERYYQRVSKTENIRAFLTAEKAHLILAGVSMEDCDKGITSISASASAKVIGAADRLTISPNAIEVWATFDDSDVICLQREDYDVVLTSGAEYPTSASSVDNIASISYTTATSSVLNATATLTIATSEYSLAEDSLGTSDNKTPFWSAQLANDFPVKVGTSETIGLNFVSSSQGQTWYTVDVILRKADSFEYGVVRTDNYGWKGDKNTFEHNDVLGWTLASNWNWSAYWGSLIGKKIYISISNNRSNSKSDIRYKIGDSTFQYYDGIPVDNNIDVFANLTIEQCYLTFIK